MTQDEQANCMIEVVGSYFSSYQNEAALKEAKMYQWAFRRFKWRLRRYLWRQRLLQLVS